MKKDNILISQNFLFLIILIILLLFSIKEIGAYTAEKSNVEFVGGGSVFVDLKFSTTGYYLKDNFENFVKNNSYVCNVNSFLKLLKDDFYDYYEGDSDGEWYFNGGTVGSPEVTFDDEIFQILKDLVQCKDGIESCNNYTFQGVTHENCHISGTGNLVFNGKRTSCYVECSKRDGVFLGGTAYCPEGLYSDWSSFFDNRVKFSKVKIESGWNNDEGIRPFAVICKSDLEGIKCLALITGVHNDLRVLWPKESPKDLIVIKNEELEKVEFLKGSNIKSFEDFVSNYNLIDASKFNSSLRINKVNTSITFDSLVISANLFNDGELPLKIKEVFVKNSRGKNYELYDLANNFYDTLFPNENKDIIILLKEDSCVLASEELILVIKYEAENFVCNYTISEEVEEPIIINKNTIINLEKKIFYPDYDFYVYSGDPKKYFDKRIDLHLGNKNGILRSFIHYDVSEINKNDLVRAYLQLNAFANTTLGKVSLYSINSDWTYGKVTFSLQPKIGYLIDVKNISYGKNNFDITEYVKRGKGFGFQIRAYDESIDQDIILYSLESENKPKIILYYKGEGTTLKQFCE
ncbi:MAG: DNRLRE domain-containing protein [Candidatus Woesearchaeota archaeon]